MCLEASIWRSSLPTSGHWRLSDSFILCLLLFHCTSFTYHIDGCSRKYAPFVNLVILFPQILINADLSVVHVDPGLKYPQQTVKVSTLQGLEPGTYWSRALIHTTWVIDSRKGKQSLWIIVTSLWNVVNLFPVNVSRHGVTVPRCHDVSVSLLQTAMLLLFLSYYLHTIFIFVYRF